MPKAPVVQDRHAVVPVIDLFAGPGGLGEGFSAFQLAEGRQPFKIHLSIEKDARAHETLRLRSFYRQFSKGNAPADYYDVLRGRTAVDALFTAHPAEAKAARRESWKATLGEVPRKVLNGRIRTALGDVEPWI